MLKLLLPTLLLAAATAGWAVEILREPATAGYGISTVNLQESTWKSRTMQPPQKSSDADRIWSGSDYFTSEFGGPLDFAQDPIKAFGFANGPYTIADGSLAFTTGERGFQFGFGTLDKNVRCGGDGPAPIRFASSWGKQKKDVYRIRLDLEQDVDATAWTFRCGSESTNFTVSGRGRRSVEADVGLVRVAIRNLETALTLACSTPKASIRIRGLAIAPSSAEVFYRRAFELAEAPVLAHASFTVAETYELYVNGTRVDTGTDIYPCAIMKSVDLRPHLRKGPNSIAFAKQSHTWTGDNPAWLFEGVAVDRSGAVTRILGDESWKCSRRRTEGWSAPGFDDAAWPAPKLSDVSIESALAKKERVFTGFNPRHMGRLAVAPVGRQQPLFDIGEAVAFTARLPVGMKEACEIRLEVCRGGTDAIVETVKPAAATDDGDFRAYPFTLTTREPGPYRLTWSLLDAAGQVLESRRDEAVIIGPITQDRLGIADFEAGFDKRLKLVQSIDCTQAVSNDAEFIDHAGMYNAPAINRGRTVERDGLRYRETGPGRWDYFAYRLHLRERGEAHLAEIIVPDDADRYIYTGVVETFPVDFCNNIGSGGTGWYTASATGVTGVRNPLSGQQRTLRFVFYPGSLNAAITVMSGFSGSPAAACTINIYRIEGGLPALTLPEGKRLFGSHNERISTMRLTTGMAEQPMMADKRFALGEHQDAWFQWYRTVERKIRLLRHQGYNMTVEGAYMYVEGDYPSAKHNVQCGNGDDFDPVPLMLRMYRRNGITCLLGFEYIASPQIELTGRNAISERRMWKGEATSRLVDRHGRQLVGYMASGYDFLDPGVGSTLLDCLAEIYQRYESSGDVAGLFLVNGFWWLPSLNSGAYRDLSDLEVGYGDATCALFEAETGIRLGVDPTDTGRFNKRYELLTGRHLARWTGWRSEKMHAFSERIRTTVQGGKNPWKLYQSTIVNPPRSGSPYDDPAAGREARDTYPITRYSEIGVKPKLYTGSAASTLAIFLPTWAKFATPGESSDHLLGWSRSPGARQLVEKFSAAYLGVGELDEVDCPATAAKRWLWSETKRGVFTPRWVGDNAMNDFVEATMEGNPPMTLFDQWIDCQLETGFGDQVRRFAASFYATPDAAFNPLPGASVSGVSAQSTILADGSTCLRLVNNTPFACAGGLTATAARVRDAVTGRDLAAAPHYPVELRPNDIRLFRIEGLAAGTLACRFNFSTEVANGIFAEVESILRDEASLKRVPGDLIARMFEAVGRRDAFAARNAMAGFEVIANLKLTRRLRQSVANQERLLGELRQKGRARIDCGSPLPHTDSAGNLWLPDQEYTDGRAYGSSGATSIDRGGLAIADTRSPRIYQTEVYGGRITYAIPVPVAAYAVRLHFAETYSGITQAGRRQIAVAINGRKLAEPVDPFALAKGACRAYVLEVPGVAADNGVVSIELTGNACINGIEVVRAAP